MGRLCLRDEQLFVTRQLSLHIMYSPYIPRGFSLWEIHVGGLARHFGQNKMIEAVEYRFYWLSLKKDVAKIVSQCRTCQLAKQQKQIAEPYTPLPVPSCPSRT